MRARIPFVLGSAALLAACAHPRPRPAAEVACRAVRADASRLRADVEALASRFQPRSAAHPGNLARAGAFLAEAFRTAGAEVEEQTYPAFRSTYRNVLARFGPDTPERIIVGAHYDAEGDDPGADDDASGVAGLLELARMLAQSPPPIRVELAAYTLEEPPGFATDSMGSVVHARSLKESEVRVRLMMSLEMIGAFSDAPGSQSVPVGMKRSAYPTTGNFIAVVGRSGHAGMVAEIAAAMRYASSVPVETLVASRDTPGVDLADHRSFWDLDYPAVMVTDTAFFRNPRYHTPEDTPDTLDYRRMSEVVEGVHCVVQAVARR
ncbi:MULTISPECIES: M28 family peptidase [unclassified Anaeromyxobacter]|uniref:M28 family peptidase n=1 Tax=unclassified Anaeromyxobacter TaxID=2620896 RepID=UPI001F56A609|nr:MULTISPECIES: M28 family peptidase [unclassified Anaeromyxobacter]